MRMSAVLATGEGYAIMLLVGSLPLLECNCKKQGGRVPVSIMKEEKDGTFTRRHTRPGPGTISPGF